MTAFPRIRGRKWWAVALTCWIFEPAQANDLLRLYELAMTRDPTLNAAAAQRDAAIEARPQALAQLLPQLVVTGSGARDRVTGTSTSAATGDTTVGSSPGCVVGDGQQRCQADTRASGLRLSQTLWSFEAFSQLKEANRLAASAEATFLAAQQALLERVAQAYFAILAAKDQVLTTRSERAAFGELLNQAKAREQTGVGPRSDVEQAQSFYDTTEQSVIDAENALDDADLAMAAIVGSQITEVAPLRDDIPLSAPDPASVDDWVTAALRDNPTVRAAELTLEASGYDISVQRGKGLPTLALQASDSRAWQDPAIGGNQSLDTIGLYINWPLFQGGAVASAVRQSRALYRQAQAQHESTLRDIEKSARAAYRGVVTGIQRISAARRAVASGHAAVEASEHNVEFGTGTEFDLLNAQNNYSAALRAYSQTRYDYLASLLTLKQQAGRLSENDLATIDAMLTGDEK